MFVRLLEEGVDVWRPVPARRLGETVYELSGEPIPEGESWAFSPGDAVVVEQRPAGGMVAVARAVDLDERSTFFRRRAV